MSRRLTTYHTQPGAMAHISTSAAIFSPSVARLASSAAKDWNYVDSWLSSKFPGRSPPPFERNTETLKALVALAALNESVDEDRDLVTSVEASALQALSDCANDETLRGYGGGSDAMILKASPVAVAESVIAAIEGDLSIEGRSAYASLASTSVELGIAYPGPAMLGRRIAELQMRLFQLEQAVSRMGVLREHVDDQLFRSQNQLKELESDGYRTVASLAKLNIELQRKVKMGATRVQDTKEKAGSSSQLPELTVQQLKEEESLYLKILAYGGALDKQIKSFQGLSPDTDLARQQLEALRTELHSATQKRDIVFEGLVEVATPKRPH